LKKYFKNERFYIFCYPLKNMKQIDLLRGLFDEKIVSVINFFLENPEKQLSLTQVSSLAKINIATTMRILDKLVKQDIVELIIVGKSKIYKMKRSEKTMALNKFLKNEEEHLLEFIDKIKQHQRLKKVILETKTNNSAKLLLVGNYLPTEKITSLVEEIRRTHHFRIQFVELTENQFHDMEKIGIYDLNKKIIWQRED